MTKEILCVSILNFKYTGQFHNFKIITNKYFHEFLGDECGVPYNTKSTLR